MSKVITQRYEYVCYDDATQTLAPSGVVMAYPTVLDQYIGNVSQSAASSFGTVNISGAGLTNIQTAPGATVTFVGPTTNTTLVNISTPSGVPLVPGGTATQVRWLVGPGQIVTFPGVWNTTGVLTAQAIDTSFTLQSTAFTLQGMYQA